MSLITRSVKPYSSSTACSQLDVGLFKRAQAARQSHTGGRRRRAVRSSKSVCVCVMTEASPRHASVHVSIVLIELSTSRAMRIDFSFHNCLIHVALHSKDSSTAAAALQLQKLHRERLQQLSLFFAKDKQIV